MMSRPSCECLADCLLEPLDDLTDCFFVVIGNGRKIRWDLQAMQIVDDTGAAKMLSREHRMPWHLG